MSNRTERLALCALGGKNEQWIRIVLPRAQAGNVCFEAVSEPPFEACGFALVDCQSPESLAAHREAQAANPRLLSLWVSDDGEQGGAGPKLARRALMFRLAPLLAEIAAGASPSAPQTPAGLATPDAPANSPLPGAPDRRLSALVVDDSLTVRLQLSAVLERIGLKTTVAATAEEAELILGRQPFDLVFLDVVLPGRDGYSVCKSLRKNGATRDLVILMLTSRGAPFDRARGALAGCDLYLTKPVQLAEVYDAVDRAVMKAFKQDRAAVLSRGYKPLSA